jgi:hypothetical protein
LVAIGEIELRILAEAEVRIDEAGDDLGRTKMGV